MDKKALVFLPTYNEAENVGRLLEDVLSLGIPGLEILVVDDASPDGTAEIVAGIAVRRPEVHLLRREGERGRGLAGREGFLYALREGFDAAVEMDADFSHPPRAIPALLGALDSCDLAVGSRLVEGGKDEDRPFLRRLLTRAANAYARILLGLPVLDANSGFRAFSRRALEALRPQTLRSRGPSIVHEALYRVARAGLTVREVPIGFVDRRRGRSKLTLRRLVAGYLWILRLRFLWRE